MFSFELCLLLLEHCYHKDNELLVQYMLLVKFVSNEIYLKYDFYSDKYDIIYIHIKMSDEYITLDK